MNEAASRLEADVSAALHTVSSVLIFSKSSDSDEVLLAVFNNDNDLLPIFSSDNKVVKLDSVNSSESGFASSFVWSLVLFFVLRLRVKWRRDFCLLSEFSIFCSWFDSFDTFSMVGRGRRRRRSFLMPPPPPFRPLSKSRGCRRWKKRRARGLLSRGGIPLFRSSCCLYASYWCLCLKKKRTDEWKKRGSH